MPERALSEGLILAALERAARHQERAAPGVLYAVVRNTWACYVARRRGAAYGRGSGSRRPRVSWSSEKNAELFLDKRALIELNERQAKKLGLSDETPPSQRLRGPHPDRDREPH